MSRARRALLALSAVASFMSILAPCDCSWSQLAAGSGRPFVTGLFPVVDSRGRAVGGVSIDSSGVLSLASETESAAFRAMGERMLAPTPRKLSQASNSRRISLRALDRSLAELRKQGKPIPQDMLLLGGLTRIQYVVVDVRHKDIVLCGRGEGWRVAASGAVVGEKTGEPIVRLEDLLVAFRLAADGGESASCSIDPTVEGSRRLQKLLASPGLRSSDSVRKRMEKMLGPQTITILGVPPTSRLAHVMLAADYQMKRLAMQLDPTAPREPASYLQMLGKAGRRPRNAAPRWWIAPHYEAVQHSTDRTTWRLSGPGIKVQYADGFVRADGSIVESGEENVVAAKWSEQFNRQIPNLSSQYPVFADLRNCVDLSVVAALIWSRRLLDMADCELPILHDAPDFQPAVYATPKTVSSKASLLRRGRDVIVAVSGGVEIDAWKVADDATVDPSLDRAADRILSRTGDAWVWE